MSKKIFGLSFVFFFFVFSGLVGATTYNFNPSGLTPVTYDLWDVSQGAQVTGFSDSYGGQINEIKEMFGATGNSPESGVSLFSDLYGSGYVHWVEWQTANPIVLTGFNIFAEHDGWDGKMYRTINYRGFTNFKLFGKLNQGDDFQLLFEYNVPQSYQYYNPYKLNGYGYQVLYLQVYDINLPAQYFKAEFVQAGDIPGVRGPRVIELDGFGSPYSPPPPSPVPVPPTMLLLGSGIAASIVMRRKLK